MNRTFAGGIKQLATQYISGNTNPNLITEYSLRASQISTHLNAFIRLTPEVALSAANESSFRYMNQAQKSVLDGIPIAIKDNFCTKDITTTCSSKMLENFVPTYNATVVQRLYDTGAVLLGKTNMDEFAMGSGSVHSHFGPVKNVWSKSFDGDEWRVAGGSSGGSAAAVAAGICFAKAFHMFHMIKQVREGYKPHIIMCKNVKGKIIAKPPPKWRQDNFQELFTAPIINHEDVNFLGWRIWRIGNAIGSDTGGSVRIPASYCGVIGLKPTYGLISRYGLIPLDNSMDTVGIFGHSMDDCVIILNAISGPDKCDSTTIKEITPKVQLPFMDELNVKNITIGIPKECYCTGLMPEIVETWRKVADMLEDEGACVKQVSIPNFLNAAYVYSVLNQCEVASNMARYDGVEFGHRAEETTSTEELYMKTRTEGFNNVVKSRILAGNFFLLKRNYDRYYIHAMKARRMIACDFSNVFQNEKIDLLLTPTTPTDAPIFSEFAQNSIRNECAISDVFTSPVNLAGLPAVSIPIRLSSQNLPLSLQLIGDRLSENLLMRVGKWIEARANFNEVEPPESVLRMIELTTTSLFPKT